MSKAIKEIYGMSLDERKLMGMKGFDYAKLHFSRETFENSLTKMLTKYAIFNMEESEIEHSKKRKFFRDLRGLLILMLQIRLKI